MKKFKTGDVVKVVSKECASYGNLGIVKKITDNKTRPYTVMFLDAESEYSEDELEKVYDCKPRNGKESRKTIPVNTSKKMVQAARAKALKSTRLRKELKDWFDRKGACPDPEVKDFVEWVERRIDYLAGHMGECRITVDSLVTALKVQAIGDANALAFEEKANRDGWLTDVNCYLEEGVVWASVWLSGKEPKETEKRAEEIAAEFRKLGYTTDIWMDEEDEGDITVNAADDFKLYLKNQKKGGR